MAKEAVLGRDGSGEEGIYVTPGCKSYLRNVERRIGSFAPRSGPSSVSVYLVALVLVIALVTGHEGLRPRLCFDLGWGSWAMGKKSIMFGVSVGPS